MNHNILVDKYPPSKSCSCEICIGYCNRPGWWTVEEARIALDKGLGSRMMLEIAPNFSFGVLSPAFKGNEGNIALQIFSRNGCTFLQNNLCELHNTGLQPLECRFCHHDRKGEGIKCHLDIEKEWHSEIGQKLVKTWTYHSQIKLLING
ncbi:MAG: hypothetical protein PHW83_06900 [Bacteroidales bacterium]|nr:hypothetical protein [Bacteroidales bacterium]